MADFALKNSLPRLSLTFLKRSALAFLLLLACLSPLCADETDFDVVEASPKPGWDELPPSTSEPDILMTLASWGPDRLLDFWDIFRIDAGIGAGVGGTIRATRYLQASYRDFSPGSLRIGGLGRRAPLMWEDSDEYGVSPINFHPSEQRDVCTYEIGIGAELFAVGAYIGFCPEELVDFFAGIFLIDTEDDDVTREYLR